MFLPRSRFFCPRHLLVSMFLSNPVLVAVLGSCRGQGSVRDGWPNCLRHNARAGGSSVAVARRYGGGAVADKDSRLSFCFKLAESVCGSGEIGSDRPTIPSHAETLVN